MSGPQTNCASSSQINYYSSCRIIEELAETRILAKQLKVLDLNRNDLPGVMYFVWAYGPRSSRRPSISHPPCHVGLR
jgi:hypothetical protein